jgi:hypothetical protein
MTERPLWTDLDELEYQVSFDMPLFVEERKGYDKPKQPTESPPVGQPVELPPKTTNHPNKKHPR